MYRIFICHSYRHGDTYDELRVHLKSAKYFPWQNDSIPDDMLVQTTDDDELHLEIKRRIERSDVVLVLTKLTKSKWLREEIRIAQELGKPIIAVTRRKRDRKNKLVLDAASQHIDSWRIDDLIHAIREEIRRSKRINIGSSVALENSASTGPTPKDVLTPSLVGDMVARPAAPRRWWQRFLPTRIGR